MKFTKLFTKTQKDAPADEQAKNAQLLIKAGYVYKEMAGVYAYLPLGIRVLEKIKQIVREEMNMIGGQEFIMTTLQRKELWEKTNRWDDEMVDIWFKTKLKSVVEIGLAWSHEEPIADMMRGYVHSYKDLPVYVYQFQTKLRNELRSKSGIMRGREFVMKDSYSMCTGEEQHNEIYEASKQAYLRIFERVGLGAITHITFASGGAFTEYSHEFQTICEAGEDVLFYSKSKDTYFNREVTASKAPPVKYKDSEEKPKQDVLGEAIIGVDELAKFLNIETERTTKTLLYKNDKEEFIAAAVRGKYKIDEDKLRKVTDSKTLTLATEDEVKLITGAAVGYVGILNLPKEVRIIVDESCDNRMNFECGANQTNYHSINVNWGRDIPKPNKFYDIKVAQEGDLDPDTDEAYEMHVAAEVGNIFNFGVSKSKDIGLNYKNEAGEDVPVWLGSYGIGITRLMGVIVEELSDERGIVWPDSISPFQVHLVGLDLHEAETKIKAEDLYKTLTDQGIEVLFDDREEARAGEKFSDADLMGISLRAVVSKRSGEQIEVKRRDSAEAEMLSVKELLGKLKDQ